jgi:hypothetical protein
VIQSAAESGFSRTFDDPGPPTDIVVLVFQGILSRLPTEKGRLHRECGRTRIRDRSQAASGLAIGLVFLSRCLLRIGSERAKQNVQDVVGHGGLALSSGIGHVALPVAAAIACCTCACISVRDTPSWESIQSDAAIKASSNLGSAFLSADRTPASKAAFSAASTCRTATS